MVLLSQELGCKCFWPFSPFTFISSFINCTEFNFSVIISVIILSAVVGIFYIRSKWVVRVLGMNGFENFLHCFVFRFISIKTNVNTIWKIVCINSHTFEIVRSIDKYSYLCIMWITKIKVFYTTTKFNNSIHINTAIFGITNWYSFTIDRSRILKLVSEYCLLIVTANFVRFIIIDCLNIGRVINFFMFCTRFAGNQHCRPLSGVCRLLYTSRIYWISLSLNNIKSLIHLFFRYSQLFINALTNVNHSFFINLLFKKISRSTGLFHSFGRIDVKQRSYWGFVLNTAFFSNCSIRPSFFF